MCNSEEFYYEIFDWAQAHEDFLGKTLPLKTADRQTSSELFKASLRPPGRHSFHGAPVPAFVANAARNARRQHNRQSMNCGL